MAGRYCDFVIAKSLDSCYCVQYTGSWLIDILQQFLNFSAAVFVKVYTTFSLFRLEFSMVRFTLSSLRSGSMALMLAGVLVWAGCGGSPEPPKTEAPVATPTPATETPATETPTTETPSATETPASSADAKMNDAKSSAIADGKATSGYGSAGKSAAGNMMASADKGAAMPEKTIAVPAGTQLKGELDGLLSSKTNKVGDIFRLVVTDPILVEKLEVIPKGTVINGTVAAVTPASSGKKGNMSLTFSSMTLISGRTLNLDASSAVEGTGDATVQGESKAGRNTAIVAGAAAAGALAGKLLGKSNKDAVVGAVVGGAAGGIAAAVMNGGEVDLKSGSALALKLNKELGVPVKVATGSNVAGK